MWVTFCVCEASVSRAVFIVVKPTFNLVAFISTKTFVSQLAEGKSLPTKGFFLMSKFSD